MSLLNPERFPVKFYSWQDTEAPQLQDVDGCIKTIIKACLVTGFGEKQGAGWAMPFEDDYRMLLRRPLRTGNPPDIKIENGVINGTPSHRIVAQDNPTSLDDSNELSAVNLLARDRTHGQEWYLMATDFAFMLCYQMGENGYHNQRNGTHVLFIGSMKKLLMSDDDYFLVNKLNAIQKSGILNPWGYGILFASSHGFYDMRTKKEYHKKHFLTLSDKDFSNQDILSPIFIDNIACLPFFASATSDNTKIQTQMVEVNSRPMLRYYNRYYQNNPHYGVRVLYIPLDYWEL